MTYLNRTAATIAFMIVSATSAVVVEDFNNPVPPDGHVPYAGSEVYVLQISGSTGGNALGNSHQNALILQNYFDLIPYDQSGSGYFLTHHTLDDGTNYAGQVWGTLPSAAVPVNPTTSYVFSFYLTNTDGVNPAVIEAFVNDESLGTPVSAVGFFADGSPAHQWQRFSFTWQSRTSTTAALSLVNLTSTGKGNDFAIDTVALDIQCLPDIAPPNGGNGVVDIDDLLSVITNWGPCPAPPATCLANITNAGTSANRVDVDDLLAVITGWGPCP